tara:strand:+ start:1546 stop:1761 length:216 start_codon:yes stop_codon:yes gene_type:complete
VLACGLTRISIGIAINTTDRLSDRWAFTWNTLSLRTSLTALTIDIFNTAIAVNFIGTVVTVTGTVTFLNGI